MERLIATDVAKVYELWNEYAAACHCGDFERWMSLWEGDGKQLAPDAPPRMGREQIQAAMKPTFDLFIMSNMDIDTGEVRILGEWAFSYGTFTFDRVAKDGGETTHISGKFLDIVKRQVDGSWKIAIDCHNYTEPYG